MNDVIKQIVKELNFSQKVKLAKLYLRYRPTIKNVKSIHRTLTEFSERLHDK
jgi:hypothetical protein